MQLATIALWASAVAVRSVAFVTPAARITSARPSALRSTTAPRQDTWQSADLKRGSPADIAAVLAERGDTAEHRRYYAYQAARAGFFTASSLWAYGSALGAGTVLDRLRGRGVTMRTPQSTFVSEADAAAPGAATSTASVEGLFGSLAELWRRDLANIDAGLYRYPYDMSTSHRQYSPLNVAAQLSRLRQSVGETADRREREGGGLEMRASTVEALDDGFEYPDYYLQNFHFQSDGWMSFKSAQAYEVGTEALFSGGQDAMQRQALAPLARFLAEPGRNAADTSLLEVAAGTGRLHTFVRDNWPKLKSTVTDMSPFYLASARENMEYFTRWSEKETGRAFAPTAFRQVAAERLSETYGDAAFDAVLNVYMFHEMPADVRRQCAKEFARVLKPGGCLVFVDSLQQGDRPEADTTLPLFASSYHEPYYNEYTQDDLVGLFEAEGLIYESSAIAHFSKVLSFRKPAGGAAEDEAEDAAPAVVDDAPPAADE